MLIDRHHKQWIGATLTVGLIALGFYLLVYIFTPGGLTGGSLIGMWYGIIGSGLMVYAGLLSALRKVPSWWWIGSRKVWLRGHIWLGLLSGLFLLCHSGFRWGGALEIALWVVVILTLVTGVVGLALQQIVPRLLTARFPNEAPYEQIPHLCNVLRHRADEVVAGVVKDDSVGDPVRKEIDRFYKKELRPFLLADYRRSSPLARPLHSELIFASLRDRAGDGPVRQQLVLLETYCDERRQWGEQERYHFLLHGWLLLHVPLSILVLVLGTAHAVASLYF